MLKDMKVKTRLVLGFGISIMLAVVVGLIGFVVAQRLSDRVEATHRDGVLGGQRLALAQNAMWELRFGVAQYLAVPKPEARKRHVESGPKWFQEMDRSLEKYSSGNLAPEARQALADLNAVYGEYKAKRQGWFDLMEAGKLEEAAEYRGRTILKSGQGSVDALTKLIDIQTKASAEAAQEAEALAGRAKSGIVMVILVAVVLAALTGLWIVRDLVRQLGGEPGYAVEVTQKIAGGDLTLDIRTAPEDRDSVLASMRQMQARLRELIAKVADNTSRVSAASGQLSAAAGDVAASSEQQSTSAASMAASVEEMTVSLSHVAESARTSESTSGRSGELADHGNRAVHDVVASMERIVGAVDHSSRIILELGERSSQISQVVKVIKEVADQTNLLALNAAIEAARAGEQGRGFAVVADEVRKLAERTTQSTQEITAMIESIQGGARRAVEAMEKASADVGEGARTAQRAGESMKEIRQCTDSVVEAVREISGSLRELSSASNQIAGDVEKIAQMTERNSGAVKDVSSSASDLSGLAGALQRDVAFFRV